MQIVERVGGEETQATARQRLKACWKHLRLPFQLTLSPIFLLGLFLARPSGVNLRALTAFVSMHFFLYTGITAYNSFFDRDLGAVGGMERPPPATDALLPISITLKTVGLVLAFFVGWVFATVYSIFILLSFLYSHPRYRWKGSPCLSLAVVCGGQGVLGYLAGWAAARGEIVSVVSEAGVLGAVTAAFTVLGLYPLTQLYQRVEDRTRGDWTLAVTLGTQQTIRLSQAAIAAAGIAGVLLASKQLQIIDSVLLAAGFGGLVSAIEWLRLNIAHMSDGRLFRVVMRISYLSAAGFACFILVRIARWG